MTVAGIRQALLDFVFPPLCHLCRRHVPDAGALHICEPCRTELAYIGQPLCTICGEPFAGSGPDHPCGTCLTDPPHFDTARAALIHQGGARTLIHSFKYHHKTHLKRPLALLITERLADHARHAACNLILPVPLHRRRLRERGFNQSLLLAEQLSRCWNIPFERQLLRRTRETIPQAELHADQRRSNVREAFAVADPAMLAGRRVMLVDDVITTGSTANECARTLKRAGARAVSVIAVARAVSD